MYENTASALGWLCCGFFCFVFQLGEFSDWIDIGIGHSNVSEHSWC